MSTAIGTWPIAGRPTDRADAISESNDAGDRRVYTLIYGQPASFCAWTIPRTCAGSVTSCVAGHCAGGLSMPGLALTIVGPARVPDATSRCIVAIAACPHMFRTV